MRKVAFSFWDGELLVEAPLATYRLRWRPEVKAEELLAKPDRWVPCWPDFRMLSPLDAPGDDPGVMADASGRAEAFSAFRDGIPWAFASAVECFNSHQWPILEMLAKQPLALDLLSSNPVLGFMLANNNVFRQTKIEAAGFQAAAYCLRKQRWILEWLGFPGTPAMVKLCTRIPPEAISPSLLRRLRTAIEAMSDTMDLLAHIRNLNEGVLGLVINVQLRELITPELLQEVSQAGYDEREMTPGDIILAGLAVLDKIKSGRRVTPITSLAQVYRFQQKVDSDYQQYLVAQEAARQAAREALEKQQEAARQAAREVLEKQQERTRVRQAQIKQQIYPSPPIPGTETIIPLVSQWELLEEGGAQSNCVASYAPRVRDGDCYIYRVTEPERATLAIVRRADGCWRRSELKAAGNAKVREETVKVIDAWLRQYRVSV